MYNKLKNKMTSHSKRQLQDTKMPRH